MKTKDLIKQLQELDSEGECNVFVGGDIFFCLRLPYYYDGKPGILIRNEQNNDKIIGIRQITETDGDKIYIYSQTLEDVVSEQVIEEHYGNNTKIIIEGNERFLEDAAKYRKETEDMMNEFVDKNIKS